MASAHSVRERIRDELRHEIIAIAQAQLATAGAAGLSLRAIARDLGMAPSAVHRYFASRDDLLTALIIDGYNAIGAAVEQADAAVARNDYLGRWLAACRALRDWALSHPHEYALVYGSPIPGYQAPPEGTVAAATRDKLVYGRILSDAMTAGALRAPTFTPTIDGTLTDDTRRLRDAALNGVPDGTVVAALTAWGALFGMVSFELFGHFNNMIDARTTLFEQSMTGLGAFMGLPARPTD